MQSLSFDSILKLRTDSTGLYSVFIEYFISPVIGKIFYKENRCERLVSDFVSVSDEAFALLIFENNHATWCDMIRQNITKSSSVICKYTNGGCSNAPNGSSRQYQGWNPEGIKRFNDLFDLVKDDRNAPHAKLFEESFRADCENKSLGKKRKKQVIFEAIHVRHELWSEDEDENKQNQIIAQDTIEADAFDDFEDEAPLPDVYDDKDILLAYKEV